MRPTLAALKEQQDVLNGVQRTAAQNDQMYKQAFQSLRAESGKDKRRIAELEQQNQALARGLRQLARLAGVEGQIKTAMFRTADVQNPAQPVPEPAAQPAPFTTVDAETPEAMADVQTPGMVGGSTNDVAADSTSTVYTPGTDVDGAALNELVDVTAPVAGTQGPLPLNQVRTETDVRVGDPMNPQVAFPLRGQFQEGQRLQTGASRQQPEGNRTMAALRLAKLRIASQTAQGTDIEVATSIERDASLSMDAIEREITVLEGVSKAAANQRRSASAQNRGLVPRARTVPSMQGVGMSHTATATSGSVTDAEVQDADLFG